MRNFSIVLSLLGIGLLCSSANAQGPFGRGPMGFRPPLPPVPVPGFFPAPGYVRVPGVGPVVPAVVAVPRPAFGYRAAAVVAVPTVVAPVAPAVYPGSPYSAARVAVVQPVPPNNLLNNQNSAGQYNAGQYGTGNPTYDARSASTNGQVVNGAALQPTANRSDISRLGNSRAGDLQPGMVLPDGAIVVSVGNASTASGRNPTPSSQSTSGPKLAPTSNGAPAASGSETRSILNPNAEELPKPQPNGSDSNSPAKRQF